MPKAPPPERYTLAEIARAFAQCCDYIELAQENRKRYPILRPKGVPYGKAQRGGEWLQDSILSVVLRGNTVELRSASWLANKSNKTISTKPK